MSTLAEIEVAVESLARLQQEALLRKLSERLEGGPACYDLVRDLFEDAGKLGGSGKRDLSTNKAHLVGFGISSGKIDR